MNRKTIILVSVVLVAVFSASVFAQKSGRSSRSHGGKQQKKNTNFNSRDRLGSGQHHFNSQLGRSQHHFNGNSQLGRSNHFSNHSRHRHNNFGGHHGHSNHGHSNYGYGYASHHHYAHGNGHFYKKYLKAQRYFVVRSNLYLVQFHKFPYDVCWHNGKYWVCYEGYWMPYSYLINNHAGAWNWHQAHYRFHNHAAFKKNFKNGNVKLIYGK